MTCLKLRKVDCITYLKFRYAKWTTSLKLRYINRLNGRLNIHLGMHILFKLPQALKVD